VPVEKTVEKIVEVEKVVEVPVEVVVDRPVEKIIEKVVEVENTQRLDQLNKDNAALKKHIKQLQEKLDQPPTVVEKIVEVEKQVPVEVERAAKGDLREAARLLSRSEFNKEDLTADDIYNMLLKSSEEDVRRKLGFWAVPLPKADSSNTDTNKKYIGKK
jgi:hypothetical protein